MKKEVLKKALEHYGIDAQRRKMYEEMAELQEALYKYEDGRASVSAVVTEIADVTIVGAQLTLQYGGDEHDESHERLLEHILDSSKALIDLYVCEAAAIVIALHSPDGECGPDTLEQLLTNLSYTVSYLAYHYSCVAEVTKEIEYKLERLAKRMEAER